MGLGFGTFLADRDGGVASGKIVGNDTTGSREAAGELRRQADPQGRDVSGDTRGKAFPSMGLFAVVWQAAEDGVGAVELFEQNKLGELVLERERAERNAFLGLGSQGVRMPVCAADEDADGVDAVQFEVAHALCPVAAGEQFPRAIEDDAVGFIGAREQGSGLDFFGRSCFYGGKFQPGEPLDASGVIRNSCFCVGEFGRSHTGNNPFHECM